MNEKEPGILLNLQISYCFLDQNGKFVILSRVLLVKKCHVFMRKYFLKNLIAM